MHDAGINSQTDLRWRTVVEVARVLTDESTITAAALRVASAAARAAVRLIKKGKIEIALDGRLVEEKKKR